MIDLYKKLKVFFSPGALAIAEASKTVSWDSWLVMWIVGERQGPIMSGHTVSIPIPSFRAYRNAVQYNLWIHSTRSQVTRRGPSVAKPMTMAAPTLHPIRPIRPPYISKLSQTHAIALLHFGQPYEPSNPIHAAADASLHSKSNN